MKKSWTILLVGIILIINLCEFVSGSGESIKVYYNETIKKGQEFNVTINLINFNLGVYDVKIDILNITNLSQRLSQIWSGSDWESTNFYLNDIVNNSQNNNSIFLLNITENYGGLAKMQVKIRDSSDKIKEGNCTINISSDVNGFKECVIEFQSSTPPPSTSTPELSLDMDWDEDEIINGLEEFDIDIIAKNLDNDETYDIKIWVEFEDNDTMISQTYIPFLKN